MNWISGKNVLAVLAGLLFCVAVGKFPESLSVTEAGFIPKEETSLETKTINTETKTAELFTGQVVRMKVSAYCPCEKCCGKFADGKTATNRDAWNTLGVAADPKLLHYGTKLEIPGIGVRAVDDTGGAMRQSAKKGIWHIDVRFHDHNEALQFGVQWLDVKILN